MGGASKQLSYTLLPLDAQFALPLSKEGTVAALHVSLLSTGRGQISNIRYFSPSQACGKYFEVLSGVQRRTQYFILPMPYRG